MECQRRGLVWGWLSTESKLRYGEDVVVDGEIKKEITIIVNTRPKTWSMGKISYEEVIVLAFDVYSEDQNVVYTIAYSRGHSSKPQGSLTKGQSVQVVDHMVFNVTKTNRS